MAASRFGFVARQFSTSPASAKLVTAPVNVFGVDGRYAHALYSAAVKEKKLEVIEKELKAIEDLFGKEKKLAEFVADPSIQRITKRDAVTKIFQKQNFSSLTVNTFAALAENGRLNKVSGVLSAFGKIMSAHRGEVQCSVTTAKPMDEANLKELKAALQAFVKKGETLQLETKVDPSLIGGMVVIVGDKYIDMSMATKIKTYTNLISQPA